MALIDPAAAQQLKQRAAALREWLADDAPYSAVDQRHLDEGSPERAYWHLGYLAALDDVLRLAGIEVTRAPGSGGKSN